MGLISGISQVNSLPGGKWHAGRRRGDRSESFQRREAPLFGVFARHHCPFAEAAAHIQFIDGNKNDFFWRALILVSVALIPVLIWFLFDVILIVVGAILIAGVRGTTENG